MPPALKAGLTDHLWSLKELVEMLERMESERENNSN